MARKKKKPGGERPRNGKGSSPGIPPHRADFPSADALMRELLDQLQGRPRQDTPLTSAQSLVQQAVRERDPQRKVQLARQALELNPDCADAYVLLAEQATRRLEALRLYQEAVAAGERALGPDAMQKYAGRFWGVLETRPFMTARLGLANSQWTCGRRDEAVQNLQELLRLNPNDNQGVRYLLVGFLLALDRDDDLGRLLEQYPDDVLAAWAYTRALHAFRQHGDTPEARTLLQSALKANRHVPDYLLSRKLTPATPPNFYSPGDDTEAVTYLCGSLPAWRFTPGALAWLRARSNPPKPDAPRPKGPLSFVKKWLTDRLPHEPAVWQADFRQLPTWIRIDSDPARPWAILVTRREDGLVLGRQIAEEEPSPALLWDTLVQTLQNPVTGRPHRPTALQVPGKETWLALKPHLGEVGIELKTAGDLQTIDEAFRHLIDRVCGNPQPGLLDVRGVTEAQAGAAYQAAAAFFRQAPWKNVGYESAIRVECDLVPGGPWFAVLMGQSGVAAGLALYEDLDLLRRAWAGTSDEQTTLQTVGTSVTFGEEWEIPVADLEASRRYGWDVARADAHPAFFHKGRGMTLRPPLTWELGLLETCLRAVPDFVARRRQEDATREEFTVQVGSELVKLALSWVPEGE